MTTTPARSDRPLDAVTSIKVKIGCLVVASVLVATLLLEVGSRSAVPGWLTLPVTLVGALAVTQWLARGMTSPLREMTAAAGRMAGGDYSVRVRATSADEVGRLARAFTTMAADLADADVQRRQLLATVSHELRTPLAAQRALLENLADGVVRPDDAALQGALAQAERLSTLVEDLLAVSRIDGGAAPLHLRTVPVHELLQRVAAEVSVSGRGRPVQISVDPPDLTVQADPDRLAQVVANLLDNAVRHSPPHGDVRVRAAVEPDQQWSLSVEDDGPGIPAHLAQQVFTRFGVGDDAGGGTGLGLAIASWVCELHGGSVTVLPGDGRSGARIRALLPTHPDMRSADGKDIVAAAPAADTNDIARRTTTVMPDGFSASNGPTGSVIDDIFGRFWPDRAPRTAGVALVCSAAVGVLAAFALPDSPFGLSTWVTLLFAGGLILWVSVRRRSRWTLFTTALCLGLSSLIVLRAAEWLTVLIVLVAGLLVATALVDARRMLGIMLGPVAWVLSAVRGLPSLRRTLAATTRYRLVWPLLRTGAVSLVALVVFVALFASGDPVFGSWVEAFTPHVAVADSFVLRVFVWFVFSGIVLAGCYLAMNPPTVDAFAPPRVQPVSRAWEWVVPVGVVIAVFVVFLAAQASAMWGGHDFVRRTTGLSYADYVHQGFAQLTVATALTLLTVVVAARVARRDTPAQRRLLRGVLGALCLLTLVVVASALFRMYVYQQAYGFTVLRLLVDAFECWLGLLVVLVMVAGVRLSGWWLPRAALATGAALLLAIGSANPEAWVARHNIERYHATGKIDLAELAGLGADATPAIADGLPPQIARCVISLQPVQQDNALSWNLGRSRAADIPGHAAPTTPQCSELVAASSP